MTLSSVSLRNLLAASTILFAVGVGYAADRHVTLTEGTVIPVTLDEALSSRTAHRGDHFTATVCNDNDYYSSLPRGTHIEGEVAAVCGADRYHAGSLELRFNTICFDGGRSVRIAGGFVAMNDARRERDGRLVATGRRDDTGNNVLIGAAGGFVLGALGKKPLEGAILGAAAGYLYSQFHRNRPEYCDVEIRRGTQFGVRLQSNLSYSSNYGGDNVNYIGITVTLDGDRLNLGGRRGIRDGDTVLVPVRPVLDAMRQSYRYDERNQTLSFDCDEGPMTARCGQRTAVYRESRRRLSGTVSIIDGEVYVPIDLVEMATGAHCRWSERGSVVSIDSRLGTLARSRR